MRGFKLFGSCLVTAAALALVVMPASDAFAAKHIEMRMSGVAVAVGSPGAIEVVIGSEECFIASAGKVTANKASKGKVATSGTSSECATGTLTEAQLGSTGKDQLKAKLTVAKPGPCKYTFTKFKGESSLPGPAFFGGTSVGKLAKKESSESCAATATEGWFAIVSNEILGQPFEDQLEA